MFDKLNKNISYSDEKKNVLFLCPQFNKKSDIKKILISYVNELKNDYNVIGIYDENIYDGFFDIDETALYDESFVYNIDINNININDSFEKIYISGLVHDIYVSVKLFFEFMSDIFTSNENIFYIPIFLNYKTHEDTLNRNIKILKPDITFHKFDNTFNLFYEYTFNLFGRYGKKTLFKPYICLLHDDIYTNDILDNFIEKNACNLVKN